MNVVANSEGGGVLFSFTINVAFRYVILTDLRWKSVHKLGLVCVMNHKVNASTLVLKSDTLGGWETGSNLEKFFGGDLFGSLELVGNRDWLDVILLDFKVGNLEVW